MIKYRKKELVLKKESQLQNKKDTLDSYVSSIKKCKTYIQLMTGLHNNVFSIGFGAWNSAKMMHSLIVRFSISQKVCTYLASKIDKLCCGMSSILKL